MESMYAIILAAGESKRLGQNKLLLTYQNKTLIEHTLETVLAVIDHVVVVVSSKSVYDLCQHFGVETVFNLEPGLGQSSSIRLGLGMVPAEADVMFVVADQPFLDTETITKLLESFTCCPQITVPQHGNNRGNPVIFPAHYRPFLLQLEGDTGGRAIIDKYADEVRLVSVNNTKLFLDIDTKEDWQALIHEDE